MSANVTHSVNRLKSFQYRVYRLKEKGKRKIDESGSYKVRNRRKRKNG